LFKTVFLRYVFAFNFNTSRLEQEVAESAEEFANHERGSLCYVRDQSVRIAVCSVGFDPRTEAIWLLEFSAPLCGLLFKTVSLQPAYLDSLRDLEQEVAESAEKNAAEQELRRRSGDHQVTANCPMLGRDNFSNYGCFCPNVLDCVPSTARVP
jgi:hypothetical protein